jgi:Leucine-rich repeat (LRR) protein
MGRVASITNHKNPEKIDDHHDHSGREEARSSMDVRDFMMSVGVQDNVNIVEPVPRTVPGAIMVGATNDAEDDTQLDVVEDEDVSDGPIIAHLAPDETDLEAMVEERLAARMAHERMESTRRQEVNRSRQVSLVSDDDVVVVADEVKDVSKHSNMTTERRNWILVMILLLFIAGGVAVYFLLRNNNTKDSSQKDELAEDSVTTPTVSQSEAPSFSPVPLDPLVDELWPWIASASEDLLPFSDPSSPQSQALSWLQDDPIAMTPGRSTRTVLERYVLAVLYYSMLGPSWRFDYLSREDVCAWNQEGQAQGNHTLLSKGVFCVEDGETIDTLSLTENNLRGSIPWELVLLTTLEYVNFESNGLTSSIPSRIGELTSLDSLLLGQNELTGSIPAGISKLTRLKWFMAVANDLTGPLPDTLPSSTLNIVLDSNRLTGPIPESWGTDMPFIQIIGLGGNLLAGSLPSSIGLLSQLGYLWIHNNLLTGTIPTELGQLSDLVWLAMEDNVFTGTVEPLCAPLEEHFILSEYFILSADCEEIDCPCCTKCCYDNKLNCDEVALNFTRWM